ncbi:hypothetical protein OG21DRAFT_1498001 [Imleria badia]|nr:hypothetical protein OG21DRAFT_1498001 [Imleria badia]
MSAVTLQSLELQQLCGYIAAATWVIIVWEGFIGFDDEVKFIWPMAWSAHIKWLYLFGKYGALALQTAVFGIQVGYLANHAIPLHYCRVYRLAEMAASTLLMLCFDAVLLLRIYALYGLRSWSSTLATSGVVIEFVTTVVSAGWTIPTTLYDSSCAMIEVAKTILVFVIGTFVAQAILLWLAYRRRESARRARSSIACVTIRDGLLVFSGIAVFLVMIFVFTIHNSPVTTLMIFWIPMVTSVATSRIILNLQRARDAQTIQQFTTEIWGLHGSADSFLLSDGPFQRRA